MILFHSGFNTFYRIHDKVFVIDRDRDRVLHAVPGRGQIYTALFRRPDPVERLPDRLGGAFIDPIAGTVNRIGIDHLRLMA